MEMNVHIRGGTKISGSVRYSNTLVPFLHVDRACMQNGIKIPVHSYYMMIHFVFSLDLNKYRKTDNDKCREWMKESIFRVWQPFWLKLSFVYF
jgi:hypothetical protein